MADLSLQMTCEQRKDRWVYSAHLRGVLAATLEAEPHGDKVLIHNRVYLWSKSLLSEYRKLYAAIRSDLKQVGMTLIITGSDRWTPKMEKYWRLMGFKVFGTCDTEAGPIPYAVMEV
jgi:hypothetical protein